mgnify:CR=1 FL=1
MQPEVEQALYSGMQAESERRKGLQERLDAIIRILLRVGL